MFKPSLSQDSKASIRIGLRKVGFLLSVGHFIWGRFVFSSEISSKFRNILNQENYLGYVIPTQASDIYPVRGYLWQRKSLDSLPYIDTEDGFRDQSISGLEWPHRQSMRTPWFDLEKYLHFLQTLVALSMQLLAIEAQRRGRGWTLLWNMCVFSCD